MSTPSIPVDSLAKSANVANIIQSATNVGTTIASAISTIQDSKKRAAFENALAFLNQDNRNQLARELQNADNEVERIRILSQALGNLQSQRISQLTTSVVEDERRKRMQSIYFAAGVVVVGGILVYLIVKTK
jgi:hypothetical protein